MWVPAKWVAAGMTGLPGTDVEVVELETGSPLPASVADVEFYVPSFFPTPASVEVMRHMRRLRVVQALTAGVDRLRPHVPAGAVLCNARGAHDAATAEWVVAATLGALREFPFFAREQSARRWAYQPTDQLATKTVLIVGYGSIGAAVSTTAPRAALTSSAPSFIRPRKSLSTRPAVCGVNGTSNTTTSADGSRAGSSVRPDTPGRGPRATRSTVTSNPASRRSTAAPIEPYPTISTVFSAS